MLNFNVLPNQSLPDSSGPRKRFVYGLLAHDVEAETSSAQPADLLFKQTCCYLSSGEGPAVVLNSLLPVSALIGVKQSLIGEKREKAGNKSVLRVPPRHRTLLSSPCLTAGTL